MKNKREIIESKYPPRNNEDIWLKDLLLYASTTKGWLPLGSEKTYSNKTELLKDTPTGGTIGIDKETGTAYLYNDVSKEWTPVGGGGGVTEITWQELKDKRDNGQLIPGSLYRITDYNCTTTQENTRSAGHQFDIVLLALSENKLAEEGWAMMHDNIYDVTFSDGVTKKCYLYDTDAYYCNLVLVDSLLGCSEIEKQGQLVIDNINKTISTDAYSLSDLNEENLPYNYFQNSNLSAWKVWYCLDNDTSRFAWADDSVDEDSPASIEVNGGDVFERSEVDDASKGEFRYAWKLGGTVLYTQNTTPSQGDSVYFDPSGIGKTDEIEAYNPPQEGTGLPNGRGVIYRLIDEFNNDIKYDFKNIQFKRKLTDGQYDANGTDTWCYTLNIWYEDMCQDASIVGNTLPNYWNYISGVYDNVFGYVTAMDLFIGDGNTFAFVLGNNVVLSVDNRGTYSGIYSNTIGNGFYSNTIGDNFNVNIIGNSFSNNTIGNGFVSNIIRNGFGNNTIGNDFYGNTIGNDFLNKNISTRLSFANYGNNGVELATKDDLN